MREETARRRVESFRLRHGDPHFHLACHAALPLALSPDLAYRLWANFQRDANGALLGIPWVAVADLLLSPLLEEVGDELYEMDEAVRSDLLERLSADARFGPGRLRRVARILDAYVEQQLNSDDIDARDFAQAQHWAALAYTAPGVAAGELARAFAAVPPADKPEVIRIASVVEALAAPLRSFTTLRTYAQAAQNLARGRDHPAIRELQSLAGPANQVEVAGVSIPVPAQEQRRDAAPVADLHVSPSPAQGRTAPGPAGGVLVREADPRRLGVHAAISAPEVSDEILPEYVPRDVDGDVRALLTVVAQRGGFVLLVGGSSVGKTRCAVEAVKARLPDWWLVHPAGPGEVAAMAQAPPSRTVVWLDDLQRYLDGEQGVSAAMVRALLSAPGPVVIIGTLNLEFYTAVFATGGADQHARNRELLDLADVIRIAPEFSLAEQERVRAGAQRDPRLQAALDSGGHRLTQTLTAARSPEPTPVPDVAEFPDSRGQPEDSREQQLGTAPVHLKIVMWGPPGIGKTTFLAALDVALKRKDYGYTLLGTTDASVNLMIAWTDKLIMRREFPPATSATDYFEWVLVRSPRRAADPIRVPGPDRITLYLTNPPGELFRPDRRNDPERARLIDDLADCDGILLMFDPIRESEVGDAFSTTNGLLHQLTAAVASRDRDNFDGTLPQHVAVCVTKFDEPKVLETARKLGILRRDPHDPHQMPWVHEHDAEKLLTASVDEPSDGEMLLHALNVCFPGRVRFFVTSAIGFYVDPRTQRFDADDPQNLVKTRLYGGEVRIRGALYPINVVEPILWLSEQVARRP